MRAHRQRGSNIRCSIIPLMYHYSLGGSASRRTPAGEGVAAMPEDERRPLSKVMPALLRRGGLQDLAAAALECALAADPDDAHALWKLAEVHRRQGDFAAARGLYGRLRTRGPDRRKAAWLHAVLNGDGAPEGAPGGVFWPAPFVWMTDFLAPEECDRLLALGVERREGLTPVKKGGVSSVPRKDSKVYLGWEMDAGTTKEIMLWFVPRIRSVLPDVLARLGMAGLDRCRIEVNMRVYLTGGFFRAHSDTFGGGLPAQDRLHVFLPPPAPALLGRGSAAPRYGRRSGRWPYRGVLPNHPVAQQHRLLSQRLPSPSDPAATRGG